MSGAITPFLIGECKVHEGASCHRPGAGAEVGTGLFHFLFLSMNEKSSSRWTLWTIAIVTVPVLYVLTLPPLYVTVIRKLPRTSQVWIIYQKPYAWTCHHTPLGGPMKWYATCWRDWLWRDNQISYNPPPPFAP